MSDVDPIIGNWYRNEETGNDFEVVAFLVVLPDAEGAAS